MLKSLGTALGIVERADDDPPLRKKMPAATDSHRWNPRRSAAANGRIPTTEARPARDHAAALLTWLQGPGGRSGTLLASELQEMHRDLCIERDWEPLGWVAVGRELRRLIGGRKEYIWHQGRRVCVYRVPPRHLSRQAA